MWIVVYRFACSRPIYNFFFVTNDSNQLLLVLLLLFIKLSSNTIEFWICGLSLVFLTVQTFGGKNICKKESPQLYC